MPPPVVTPEPEPEAALAEAKATLPAGQLKQQLQMLQELQAENARLSEFIKQYSTTSDKVWRCSGCLSIMLPCDVSLIVIATLSPCPMFSSRRWSRKTQSSSPSPTSYSHSSTTSSPRPWSAMAMSYR